VARSVLSSHLVLRRRPMDPQLAMLGRRAERLRLEHE
jgi:hypothetical protein